MSQTINWRAPSTTSVIEHEVSRATTYYGTYNVLAVASSFVSSNWVTSYVDPTGNYTHWYRLRFYDNYTNGWSEYSLPISSEENVRLCTVDEVKRVIDTVGRWTDDEIFDVITDVDNFIYYEFGKPLASSYFPVGTINADLQDTYYIGEEGVHRIDRLFYGTTTKTELFLEDGYKANNRFGMIKILPVGSSGVELDTQCEIEVHYAPGVFNKLSMYRTCKRLLEKIDFTSGGDTSKELATIENRLSEIEKIFMDKCGVQLSSDVANYDKVYGVNRKKVVQNHDRNNFIGKYGWA